MLFLETAPIQEASPWIAFFSALFAAVSAVAAVAAIWITLSHSLPRIKINCDKKQNTAFPCNVYVSREKDAFAFVLARITNKSGAVATITSCELKIDKITYSTLVLGQQFIPPFNGDLENVKTKLKTNIFDKIVFFPLTIAPYGYAEVIILFPNFCVSTSPVIKGKIHFEFTRQLKKRQTVYLVHREPKIVAAPIRQYSLEDLVKQKIEEAIPLFIEYFHSLKG